MSKIPYSFETPIPVYFRKNGWFKPKKDGHHLKAFIFISWCFSRCSTVKRKVYHDHKEIELEPFEFIFGRRICSEETGLTEQEIRTLINQLFYTPNGSLLKKSTNSVTNRFTCYIWSTEVFCENNNQLNNQPVTNRQPTDNHNLEDRSKKKEKEKQAREAAKPPDVISLNKRVKIEEEHLCLKTGSVQGQSFPETTSDNIRLISNSEEVTENKKNICQEKKRSTQSNPKISFRDNVLLTQLEHDKLLATHGNPALDWMLDKLSNQKHSRGIKYKSDYHAILNWVVDAYTQSSQLNKSSSSNSIEENRKLAKSVFHDFQSSHYKIEILSKGVEFVPNSGQKAPEFLDFSSNGFKDQLNSILEKLKFSRKVSLVELKHG